MSREILNESLIIGIVSVKLGTKFFWKMFHMYALGEHSRKVPWRCVSDVASHFIRRNATEYEKEVRPLHVINCAKRRITNLLPRMLLCVCVYVLNANVVIESQACFLPWDACNDACCVEMRFGMWSTFHSFYILAFLVPLLKCACAENVAAFVKTSLCALWLFRTCTLRCVQFLAFLCLWRILS